MKDILENAKDFKIIPNNFKSSGEFEVVSLSDDEFKVKLKLSDETELSDYKKGENVEVFAVNNVGLIYFETTILNKENDILSLSASQDYSVIQRREYSRVEPAQAKLTFLDMPENTVEIVKDISAGGIRFICNQELSIDKSYEVEVALSNNMTISCTLQPIRTRETEKGKYMVSAKFANLENVDRVVLVQYAFKIKMEEQNR